MSLRSIALGVTAVIVCVAAAVLRAAPETETETPKSELSAQVEQLLERVAQLEDRVAQLENRRPLITIPVPQPDQSVPKNWQRREFNGQNYYIVPLDGSQPQAPVKLKVR